MRSADARTVFGCASVLLSYPDDHFGDDLAAVRVALEKLPRNRARRGLGEVATRLADMTELEATAGYVDTFDLARRRTLHLSYYRHGDTRERGLALAALSATYRDAGMPLRPGELPDLLPALLELAAVSAAGVAVLREHRSALETLRRELEDAQSPYAKVLAAIGDALGPATRGDLSAMRRYRAQGPPSERVGLEPFAPPEVIHGGLTAR